MRFSPLLSASFASYVMAMQQLDPDTLKAMSSIKQACERDVDRLCPDPSAMFLNSRAFIFESPPDPILDLMMNPSAPPPLLMDVNFVLDAMITQALSFSNEHPAPVIRTFHFGTIEGTEIFENSFRFTAPLFADGGKIEDDEIPEKILDSMVQTLVDKSHEESAAVVERIVRHGNDLLLKTNHRDDDFVRMARRLTQTAESSGRRSVHTPLPFGCPRNRCLVNAFEQGAVSPVCARAMTVAEEGSRSTTVRREEVETYSLSEEDARFIVLGLSYFILSVATAFLLRNKMKKRGNNDRKESRACHVAIGLVAFAFLLASIFTSPVYIVMFGLCVMMMARFILLAFTSCCDEDEDECCDNDSDCYGEYKPPVLHAKEAVYEGILIKVV